MNPIRTRAYLSIVELDLETTASAFMWNCHVSKLFLRRLLRKDALNDISRDISETDVMPTKSAG
ncbi:MAG: hypothetical protein OXF08_07285 [Bacteroidetes bacterium]|nr:hypothetical protein [Bacteroidota bacterium]